MMTLEQILSVEERGIRLGPGDKCQVWEALSYMRPAVVIRLKRTQQAYRVRFLDTGAINTVSWYIVYPDASGSNPTPPSLPN